MCKRHQLLQNRMTQINLFISYKIGHAFVVDFDLRKDMIMAKAPNKFLAPVIIAGITVGFLASARRFIFAKPKRTNTAQTENKTAPLDKSVSHHLKDDEK